MTLQQLEYIIAVEKYRSFVDAADDCGVTQSTLSLMVKKLEDELDVKIFNRDKHPVTVTEVGKDVISEAKLIMFHARQIKELTNIERELSSGDLNIALNTTVAPVLMAGMFKYLTIFHPDIMLRMEEMLTDTIVSKLKKAEIDMGILNYPVKDPDLLEIPLYHERFFAYVSPKNEAMLQKEHFELEELLEHPVWIMKDGIRLFDRSMLRSDETLTFEKVYEGGRVVILIQIVNENGGITIVPETHAALMSEELRANLRPIVNPEPKRTIGLAFRKDFIHERMMNIVVKAIKRRCLTTWFARTICGYNSAVKASAICSSHCWSVASKVDRCSLSMSSTPTTSPFLISGTTISLFDSELHAMWPGNCSTSSTTMVRFSFHAVPHTPLPKPMRVQATGPWNGPSTNCPSMIR